MTRRPRAPGTVSRARVARALPRAWTCTRALGPLLDHGADSGGPSTGTEQRHDGVARLTSRRRLVTRARKPATSVLSPTSLLSSAHQNVFTAPARCAMRVWRSHAARNRSLVRHRDVAGGVLLLQRRQRCSELRGWNIERFVREFDAGGFQRGVLEPRGQRMPHGVAEQHQAAGKLHSFGWPGRAVRRSNTRRISPSSSFSVAR